jgi:hypothetical protein
MQAVVSYSIENRLKIFQEAFMRKKFLTGGDCKHLVQGERQGRFGNQVKVDQI